MFLGEGVLRKVRIGAIRLSEEQHTGVRFSHLSPFERVVYSVPMRTPEEQRRYQREWLARRRAAWFAENGPCVDCGSWEELQLDHVDASQKIEHNVWSWAKARRLAELAKCVVRCQPCHWDKTRKNFETTTVLIESQVLEIRQLIVDGVSQRSLASRFGVSRGCIQAISEGETWRHLL